MESQPPGSPYHLFLTAALSTPITNYVFGFSLIFIVFLYNFLEMHFFEDLFTGFRGQPVRLTFSASSQLYHDVVSKCKVLHGRYLSTPWLSSPHLQTGFVHFFGNAPVVSYRRQIFTTPDGGTLALDWVINKKDFQANDAIGRDARNPIMLIVPGLTSASDSSYIKHLAFKMAKHGWNVVVSNHRGLGGVPITSDCFYSGGWTGDVRILVDHLHSQYPEAPLFAVGTSIGANILVKYLGENGNDVPLIGAAVICSPWDLLLCDRFMNRRLVQKLYNKALTIGLKEYANLHKAVLSRLSNWEGVKKSRSVREFDDCATRILGNFETVDAYYRGSSSCNFIGNVMVPTLCISSLDDPVCPSEAIPWDECRLNSNIVLATTQHGGHLPFFEGLTASTIWWVRALEEYFIALQSSPLSVRRKEIPVSDVNPLELSINQTPSVHVSEGVISAVRNEAAEVTAHYKKDTDENRTEECARGKLANAEPTEGSGIARTPDKNTDDKVNQVKKGLNQLSRQNRKSLWLLAYIAIFTSWPVVGPVLTLFLRKKLQALFPKHLR